MTSERQTLLGEALPYPTGAVRKLLQLPVWLYRLGLGGLLGTMPLMVLTTRGRKTGLPRHTPVEYRQHGSKLYVISAWGDRPEWLKNLRAYPDVTIQRGPRRFAARASIVEDEGEVLRVLYLFRRHVPVVYDVLMGRYSSRPSAGMQRLADVSDAFTIVRLDRQPTDPLPVKPVPADLAWVLPLGVATMVITLAMFVFAKTRRD